VIQLIRSYRSMATTVAVSLMMFALHAAQGILLARALGPTGRGEYGTAVFYTQLLTFIGLFGTSFAITRRAVRDEPGRGALAGAGIRLGGLTGAFSFGMVGLLAVFALPEDKQYLAPLCVLAAVALPLDHVRLNLLAVDRGSGAFSRFNRNRLVAGATLPVLLLGFVTVGKEPAVTTVVCLTLAVPVVALAYRFAFYRRFNLQPTGGPSSRLLMKEGAPFAAASSSSDLFNRLDGFLVLWLASFTVQGFYAAATAASNALAVAPHAIGIFAFNSGARGDEVVTRRQVFRAGLSLAGFQLLTGLAFAAVAAPLVVLVFGEEFRGAIPFVLALIPAKALLGFACVAEGYLRGRRKPKVEIGSRVIGAATMIVAVAVLYQNYGAWSIAVAAGVGHGVTCLLLSLAVWRDAAPTSNKAVFAAQNDVQRTKTTITR